MILLKFYTKANKHYIFTNSILYIFAEQARNMTKLRLREKLISWLQEHREIELNYVKQFIQLANVQKGLHAYIETLKQKQN